MKYFEDHRLRFNREVRAHAVKTLDRLSWITMPLGTILGYAEDSWQTAVLAMASFCVLQTAVIVVLSIEEKAKSRDEEKSSSEGLK